MSLLSAGDENAPVLRTHGILGWISPCLEKFWLRGIPFLDIPQLLLSARDLVHLQLEKILDSGYFSPEGMITTRTKLEAISIDFIGNRQPAMKPPHLYAFILPALISLSSKAMANVFKVLSLESKTESFRVSISLSIYHQASIVKSIRVGV